MLNLSLVYLDDDKMDMFMIIMDAVGLDVNILQNVADGKGVLAMDGVEPLVPPGAILIDPRNQPPSRPQGTPEYEQADYRNKQNRPIVGLIEDYTAILDHPAIPEPTRHQAVKGLKAHLEECLYRSN